MNAAEWSQLQQVLHGRCEAVADCWYQAIAATSHVPLKAEVRQHLVEWTEEAMALLLAEPFEWDKAEAIGAALARLRHVQPEALGRTQEVLARQLVEGLPADQAVALQPRLAALLGGLAAGFLWQVRETILTEQGQIRSAFLTEARLAGETLREARDQLEMRVEERTAELARANAELQAEITERKRAEEALRQRTAQLEALRQVGLGLTAQLDLNTLLRSIVARAVALLGGTSGGLDLYRPEQDALEWTATIGPDLAPTGAILRRGEGLPGKVWKSGEPIIVDDYQHWEERAAVWEGYPLGAVVGVPVCWGDEFLGVLEVLADPPRTFSPADAELLSLFATQAAIAIQNAHLFEREREQRELAEALEEAAAAVSSTLDLDQVLDHILEQVERVVAGDAFSVILVEEDLVRVARWRGYELPGEEAQSLRFGVPIAEYPNLMKMARTGKPVVVPDTSVASDWVPAARDRGWRRSYVGAPIQVAGSTMGFLNVSGTRPGQFGPEDARRLEAFADHAATAIENARLYEQAQRDAETRAMLLREVNHRVKNNLSAIIGLLYAERRHAGVEDQAVYQSVMQSLVSRVQGLAAVHSLLSASAWAPLRLSELATQIIRSSLKALPSDKRVSVDVSPSPVRVTPDQAHNLALVINELTTNTVKHALQERDKGHITVHIAFEDDMVLFEFRDDGPGHPKEVLQLKRHAVGFDLIQTLVRDSLRGELTLHNDHGAVTTIRFEKDLSVDEQGEGD